MKKTKFSIRKHVPKYSLLLFNALQTPIVIFIAVLGNIITFGSAFIFWYLEKDINPHLKTWLDAAWWALCTVSTVGFGDVVPVTLYGRLIGIFLITTGVILFVTFTAVLSALLMREITQDIMDVETDMVENLKNITSSIEILEKRLKKFESN